MGFYPKGGRAAVLIGLWLMGSFPFFNEIFKEIYVESREECWEFILQDTQLNSMSSKIYQTDMVDMG